MEHLLRVATTTTNTTGPPTTKIQRLNEEVEAQMAIAAKEKKTANLVEIEIEQLHAKL